MFKISPYVPYIYKCSKIKNFKKFYNDLKKKNYIDLINFSKGLYLYLCNFPHKQDELLINFAKTLFRDITKNELVRCDKKDLCLLMLLYLKCKKVCKKFILEKKEINYISSAIEENIDDFDEEDLSTVLTFLNCTNNYKLYADSNAEKNKVNTNITKQIIERSTHYLHNFNQMKNLCILYSYLCRENISVQLHNKILKQIFNGLDKCEDTDLTNIVFNFYYINSFFFKNLLNKILEFFIYYQNKLKISDKKKLCEIQKNVNTIYNCDKNENKYEKDGKLNLISLRKNKLINYIEKYQNFKEFIDDKFVISKNESNLKDKNVNITYNNLFNIYNCNIYVYRFINEYNKIFKKHKIKKLTDQCNFVDNVWKNCRLLYNFYIYFKYYISRSNYQINIDDIKNDVINNYNFNIYNSKLYSNIFTPNNIKIFMYIYSNGVNYHYHYFNGCREFLNKYILDILQTNSKKEKEKEKNTVKLINNEHINILLNILNQMSIYNDNIYNLIMDNFKINQNYTLKTTILLLQFSFSHGCNHEYYILYKYINKIIDDHIIFDSIFFPNNYGYLFFPPFIFNNKIYTLYIKTFLKCCTHYLRKKENIQSYKLNDELFYFGLCYNILLYQEKNKLFLKFFKLDDLRKIYEFLHKFEKITKKNSSYIDNTKTKKLNIYYFFLQKNKIKNLLKYIEISYSQIENMYINFFNFFNIHQNYSYIYINYDNHYYIPSIVPSIIIQK
ncbi:conserved Plasmodium protein, unknown function [Plasmodium gallinaceum]|uniref:Uncharacterized protein n=1 Tax=Plasmodium gallinaceum TaxID=5849 RepID=A0A1J1GWE1_PLAGA|nr:conserved Plasmodium protein, unknown function [Plasmodium gallinaceum]CRG96637.1 conserved Plasmodium protein, unknown function [Plasmodium gallinaceum]